MDRIVVTGIGACSPFGVGLAALSEGVVAGRVCLSPAPAAIASGTEASLCGAVPDFDPVEVLGSKEARRTDRFIHLAVAAASEAVSASGIDAASGIGSSVIGTATGGIGTLDRAGATLRSRGPGKLSPFTVPAVLSNMAAAAVSMRFGMTGPTGSPVLACAAGLRALADAAGMVASGEADFAVAGGSDAPLEAICMAGFSAAGALSPDGDPRTASVPFSRSRSGFVMAEGACAMVLERLGPALARGAVPLLEVLGWASTSDAYHVTSGRPDGSMAARAMSLAMARAGVAPSEVGLVHAHGTSTPAGDAAELAALALAFGGDCPPVYSSKALMGHAMGASGAIGVAAAAALLSSGSAPDLSYLSDPEPLAESLGVARARPPRSDVALVNAFAFGGANVSLCVRLAR